MDKSLWKLASIWDPEADDQPGGFWMGVRHVRVLDRGAGWHRPVWVAVKLLTCRALASYVHSQVFFPGKLTLGWSLLLTEISQNFLSFQRGFKYESLFEGSEQDLNQSLIPGGAES